MRAVRRAFLARFSQSHVVGGVLCIVAVSAVATACAVAARGEGQAFWGAPLETPSPLAIMFDRTATPDQAAAPPLAAASPPPAIQPAPASPPAHLDTPEPVTPAPSAEPTAKAAPVLRDNQVIVYYGTPLSDGLGILGTLPPEQAAVQVAEHARTYDSLNGDLGAVGALDVIYSLAQAEPTGNGMYIRHLEDHYVEQYLRVAEEHDLQIFLDLQIGRRQILDEVRGIERWLLNPRVHVAIDPEYAVGPEGVPIATPGRITGNEINDVQTYLRDLVQAHGLPGKMLVVHQYMEETVVDAERVEVIDDIDFVLNMDGLGDVGEKREKYEHFSSKPHSKNDAFNVFLVHDYRVLSEEEILGLRPVPRIVFYQ